MRQAASGLHAKEVNQYPPAYSVVFQHGRMSLFTNLVSTDGQKRCAVSIPACATKKTSAPKQHAGLQPLQTGYPM